MRLYALHLRFLHQPLILAVLFNIVRFKFCLQQILLHVEKHPVFNLDLAEVVWQVADVVEAHNESFFRVIETAWRKSHAVADVSASASYPILLLQLLLV